MINAFTSMDRKYFDRVGHRMISSFKEHWPDDVDLFVYWEGNDIPGELIHHRIVVKDLEFISNLVAFCERNKDRPGNTSTALERGANRFAPKGYSIIKELEDTTANYSIWIDADTFTHTKIDEAFFDYVIDEKACVTYLGRSSYTETGFMVFNNNHSTMKKFLEIFRSMYDDDLIFNENLWHDCIAFDVARVKSGCETNLNLSPSGTAYGHVFVKSGLGKYMDHMKGPRKDAGRTPKTEATHNIEYWK